MSPQLRDVLKFQHNIFEDGKQKQKKIHYHAQKSFQSFRITNAIQTHMGKHLKMVIK